MTRDPWKLVTSVGELRAGLTVELRPCNWCGGRERFVLLRTVEPFPLGTTASGELFLTPSGTVAWITTTRCTSRTQRERTVLTRAIANRRLYALIDDDTADDETTVTRRREMVK